MEHDQVALLGCSRDELQHPSRRVGTDDEQPIVKVDHSHGVGDGVSDGFLADAVASSRRSDPHACYVPQYLRNAVRPNYVATFER